MGAVVAISLLALGTGLQAAGQYQAGRTALRTARLNARLAERQAEDALDRGQEAETRYRQAVRGLIGRQQAAFAAQGLDPFAGSPAELQEDTAVLGELDALTIRNNAAREAWGYRVQAAGYRGQGAAAAGAGTTQAISGLLISGGSLAYRMFGDSGSLGSGGGTPVRGTYSGEWAP